MWHPLGSWARGALRFLGTDVSIFPLVCLPENHSWWKGAQSDANSSHALGNMKLVGLLDCWILHSFLCRGQLPFSGFLFHLAVIFGCCCLFFLKILTRSCPWQLLGECYKPPVTHLLCTGMIITAVKFCYPAAQNIPALMKCRHKTNSHNPRAIHKQKNKMGF